MSLLSPQQINSAVSQSALSYLLDERASVQWTYFLSVFSEEMKSQLSNEEYRALLRSMGEKMAARLPIEPSETIELLEITMNKQLKRIKWGYVNLIDAGTMLSILHHFDPLSTLLETNQDISGGFLEGLYQQWFTTTGADSGLTVKQNQQSSTNTVIQYHLGRH